MFAAHRHACDKGICTLLVPGAESVYRYILLLKATLTIEGLSRVSHFALGRRFRNVNEKAGNNCGNTDTESIDDIPREFVRALGRG